MWENPLEMGSNSKDITFFAWVKEKNVLYSTERIGEGRGLKREKGRGDGEKEGGDPVLWEVDPLPLQSMQLQSWAQLND